MRRPSFLSRFCKRSATRRRPSRSSAKGKSNKSDLGGVLQTNNVHIAIAQAGDVTRRLCELKASPATARFKAKFIVATDGETFEAENLISGDTVACAYQDFPDHFGFFLPLAGITTVQQISENSFDIRATSRLNRLYVELLQNNPEWGTEGRRHDMNHFMARLIFCFFAEDTDIFSGGSLFTRTVEQMSERDSSNTHEVISTLFLAMNTKAAERQAAGVPRWAEAFPYVNGGLFSGSLDVPRLSKLARSYLLHIGGLDWKRINPDIFGSMIQAVAEDEERGELGMHYTSVPNILKVLNPLFLDDLRTKLDDAGDNPRSLLNLRKRIARIRVFDPACGSGNFLVIAYKEMRAIEAEINKRRKELDRATEISLKNFRGIELRDFPTEIARLALIIAEYQCNVLYRGQTLALAEFLPLQADNWITCGNALRLDWLSVCPPTGTGVKFQADDLFSTPLDQAQIDFENEGGETYICGNPPYRGSSWQSRDQKSDLETLCAGRIKSWKSLDYVAGWFIKASQSLADINTRCSFVSTKTICEGEQAPILWPFLFSHGLSIQFANLPFTWSNLASKKAGVTVVVIGIGSRTGPKLIIEGDVQRSVSLIGPYLVPGTDVVIGKTMHPLFGMSKMLRGNMPTDGGNFILSREEAEEFRGRYPGASRFIRPFMGASEVTGGNRRYCIWIDADQLSVAMDNEFLRERIERVRTMRAASSAPTTRNTRVPPYRFMQIEGLADKYSIAVPAITSENRDFLPATLLDGSVVLSNKCYALYDAPLWNLSVAMSTVHRVWISTVCARMRSDYSYSNTLGWNTFPVPTFTDKNKADLTQCADDILLVREAHFPATIADLYDPDAMPADLREAHERNDEVLERIYIGRRFRNDTERLEKLFELYTKMTAAKKGQSEKKGIKA